MRLAVVILAGLFATVAGSGCTAGVKNVGGSGGQGGGAAPGSGGAAPMPTGPCEGLGCKQSTCTKGPCTVPACPGGARTTVSGKVLDPAGKNPLYNITVYVPNKPVSPFIDGPTCDPCDPATGTSLLTGSPVVVTRTDVTGAFKLGAGEGGDVPAGDNIPLVIQVGKWRRELTLPHVEACANNELTDTNATRLPRNQTEGHLPKIALTTGERDALECLLRKVGISDSEFTPEAGAGRINLFAGGGGAASYDTTVNAGAPFTAVNPWWDSLDNLKKYDIVLHACEGNGGSFQGNQEPTSTKSLAARQALQDYADLGGRVFASHWHVFWLEKGPAAFQSIGTFNHTNGPLPPDYPATIDQGFTTGQAMAQWMTTVGGSTMPGIVNINQDASGQSVAAVAGSNISQRWIYAASRTPQSVLYLSATTPVPGGHCGRVVFSDLHVSSGAAVGSDMPSLPFPTGCVTTDLTPQEKVLEFMLFDISTCVSPVVP